MNWVDVIIIVTLLVFITIGVWKGFMFSFLSLFSGLVNVFLSIILTRPVSSLLSTVGLKGAIANQYISKFAHLPDFQINLADIANPTGFAKNAITHSNLPALSKTVTKWFMKIPESELQGRGSVTLSNILSQAYSSFWCTLIAFVLSFALIMIVLFLLSKLAKKSKEITVINKTDRFLGFVFGTVRGALIICAIFAFLSFFNRNGILKALFDYIDRSLIGKWAFKNVSHFMNTYIDLKSIIIAIFK